jgi:hypothetical protein
MAPPATEPRVGEFVEIVQKTLGAREDFKTFMNPAPRNYRDNIRFRFKSFNDFWGDERQDPRKDVVAWMRAALPDAVRRYIKERDDYLRDIPKLLDKVRWSRTGKPLFREITARGDKEVLIVPFQKDEQNAEVIVDPEHTEDALVLGYPQRDAKTGMEFEGAKPGTGKGTDPTVLFTPGMWKGEQGPATFADEVLFHELVHASRIIRGVQYLQHVDHDYDNREEYIAVVLTNIYLAEKGQTKLRADHSFHDDNPKARILIDPKNFLKNPQGVNITPVELIGSFKIRQPILYGALADIPKSVAWFNPIREYRELSKKFVDYP